MPESLPGSAFEHKRARNDAAEIHYVVAGHGEAVVLLHGFPETWFGWRKIIPLLAGTYRVIAPDLRGLGESSRPESGYDKKTVATDLEAVIAAEGLTRYHLVGTDMGAAVGFPLAMRDHERVSSFVFMSSALAGVGLERLYDYSAIGLSAWYWTLFQHKMFGPMLTSGHQREMLISWAYRGSALRDDAIPDDAIEEYLRYYADPDGWRAALQYYSTLDQDAADNRALLAGGRLLRMPTLGIDGEHDGRLSTATLAQIATDVRGTLIPGCKHWIPEEQPEALAQVLLEFFAHSHSPVRDDSQGAPVSSAQHSNARAIIQNTDGLVTFIQIWDVADTAAQSAWLSIMHGNIDLLRAKPGFISMTLHSSVDGKRIAVYAQWSSHAALEDAISDPAAIAAHDRMAQIGTPDGTLYTLDRAYTPTA